MSRKKKQIEGEEKVERRESSLLHPTMAAELAGAHRNRAATATSVTRGASRARERGEKRGKKTGSVS